MRSYEEMLINSFIEWLEDNELDYQYQSQRTIGKFNEPIIYVNFPDGSYVRVSEFDNPHSLYVRDTGVITRMSVFELTQNILERKGEI